MQRHQYKKSAITLAILAISAPVIAEINERPVSGKVYDDFLFYDNDGSKVVLIQNLPGTKPVVQDYILNKGGRLDSSAGGYQVVLVNGESDASRATNFQIGRDQQFHVLAYNASTALKAENQGSLNVKGGHIVLEAGQKEAVVGSDCAIIHSEDGGNIDIQAESFWMGNKSTDLHNAGGMNIVDGSASLNLEQTFIADQVDFGIAVSKHATKYDTKFSLSADQGITINAGRRKNEQSSQFRGAGVYVLGWDEKEQLSVELLSKKGDITILAQGYGYYGYGALDSVIDSVEGSVNITSQDRIGLYLSNGNAKQTHSFQLHAKNTITIVSHGGKSSALSLDETNAVAVMTSDLANIKIASDHGDGIFAYGLSEQERAQLQLTAGGEINIQGYEYGLRAQNSITRTQSETLSINAENGWAICLFTGAELHGTAATSVVIDGWTYASDAMLKLRAPSVQFNRQITANNGADVDVRASEVLTMSVDSADANKLIVSADGIGTKVNTEAPSAYIMGSIQVTNGGSVVMNNGQDSMLLGSTTIINDQTDVLNLSFGKKSSWVLTQSSSLTELKGQETIIDFQGNEGKYHTLTTGHFSGSGNTLRMWVNLAKESQADALLNQMTITGKAEGAHIADIKIDGRDLVPEKWHSENWLVSQGAGSNMTITNKDGTNQFSGNGMVTTWALAFVEKGQEGKLNTAEGLAQLVGSTTGNGEGKWYLVRSDEELPNPGPNPNPNPGPNPNDPGEMQQITNLGISASQAMSFASELDDLRSRLGEVRYGAQDGLWVRASHMKQTADGYNGRGFEQKTEDLHLGLDRLVATDENGSWLVGGALRYAKSDQEGFAAARGGDGELKQYSAKLYATYMHTGGSYADFVLQAGRYDQDIKGLANDKESAYSADYKTWGYGASIEAGHMFSFLEGADDRQWYNHAFIEPQLQLSYFRAHGKDFRTSTGLAVSQDDADFLTGRAGVVIGKKFNFATVDDLDKRYFQIGLTGGVKYEFLGDQDIRFTGVEGVTKVRKADDVDGARYYYGVTADWQFSDDFRAYAQIEREEGDHYTKDYDISVGLKYAF